MLASDVTTLYTNETKANLVRKLLQLLEQKKCSKILQQINYKRKLSYTEFD